MRLSKSERNKEYVKKALGSEPSWDKTKGIEQIPKLLNWYSQNQSRTESFEYFIEYLNFKEFDKKIIKEIQKIGEDKLNISIGWLSRIILLGGMPGEKELGHLNDEIEKYKGLISNNEEQEEVKKTVRKASIQDRLEEQLNRYFSYIEEEIDNFLENEIKIKTRRFSAAKWFSDSKMPYLQARKIGDYYFKILMELKEAHEGTCPQLKEAYDYFTAKQLKSYIKYIDLIVVSARGWEEIAKEITKENRKPRTKKAKSPLQQTAKIKYLKEHENLKSIPPTEIIGASQLVVYNVKTRMLGIYYCSNNHGFAMKGTSILNFDSEKSIMKKLRKPEEILESVLNSGKGQLRKIIEDIKAKEKPLTGRINVDTILVRTLK